MAGPSPLGVRLRQLRQARGLTQEELALELGVSQPSVARWEAGSREPRLSTLQRIAGALGYTVLALDFREKRP